jgi:hypothetical protein
VSIRAPLKLAEKYDSTLSYFLDKNGDIDLDGNGVNDDIIVNRALFGYT